MRHASLLPVSAAIAFVSVVAPGAALSAPDTAKGKIVWLRCAVCHSRDAGVNKVGPTLAGVFGRRAGIVPGYSYSPALKAAKITWSDATLDQFLVKPNAYVPGSRMAYAGLPNPGDRANLIAYLRETTR